MRKEWEHPENYSDQLASLVGFINRACAFTGHRPQKFPWRYNEGDPACVALKETLANHNKIAFLTPYCSNIGSSVFSALPLYKSAHSPHHQFECKGKTSLTHADTTYTGQKYTLVP